MTQKKVEIMWWYICIKKSLLMNPNAESYVLLWNIHVFVDVYTELLPLDKRAFHQNDLDYPFILSTLCVDTPDHPMIKVSVLCQHQGSNKATIITSHIETLGQP